MSKRLIVITGPTGVGKSEQCINLALLLSAPIVSCDSRQIYKEMTIGTAVPTKEQQEAVKHYFIQSHSINQHYSVGDYEQEALALLQELFKSHDTILMVGGTGLYIDIVCKGMDDIPSCPASVRDAIMERVKNGEYNQLLEELKVKDPEYYNVVEHNNVQRVTRALEVFEVSGKPYSSFRTGERRERFFDTTYICITRPREELYERINKRVDIMMESGLLQEVQGLLPYRELNALRSVGYREFFDYFDGKITLEEAIELVKRNSRRYAKRQETWFRRNSEMISLSPAVLNDIIEKSEDVSSFLDILNTKH